MIKLFEAVFLDGSRIFNPLAYFKTGFKLSEIIASKGITLMKKLADKFGNRGENPPKYT